MAAFIFGDRIIDVNDISSLEIGGNDFEGKVLTFAKDWLSNKNEFEFKTSGSTGISKKITFYRKQIKASAQLTINTFKLTAGQTALLCLEPDFIAGKMMIVRSLEGNLNLVCLPPSANPLEGLVHTTIDFAALVPYQLDAILKNPLTVNKLSRIKKIIVGGASVSKNLEQPLQKFSAIFYETYGMTETLTHIAIRKLNPPEESFHLLEGIKISTDEENCLGIIAHHISDSILQTNDVAEIIGGNRFKILGRRDNIINTGGIKVQPEIIEHKILNSELPSLKNRNFIVTGIPHLTLGQQVVLIIEGDAPASSEILTIIELLRSHLEKFEVPKSIHYLHQIPRTESGKINRLLAKQSIL